MIDMFPSFSPKQSGTAVHDAQNIKTLLAIFDKNK
jgi:hypothetical protein